MPTTPARDIELIDIGSFGKETISNDAFVNLEQGISGAVTIALTGDRILTETEALNFVLILTGALTANVTLTVPPSSRVYIVDNRTTGAFTVTVRTATGGGIAVDPAARTLIYSDGANVYPVASGTGGGGGSGAPTDAGYLVGAAHSLLTGERVVTNTATVTWDLGTLGQARAVIPNDAITYSLLQNVAASRLLGRFTAGAGDAEEISLGTNLTLTAGGVLNATGGGQPLDATLTALAGVTTAADTLEYFTGVDTAASTPLTPFARTLLDDATQAAMRTTLALTPGTDVQAQDATLTALAGVTTGANTLPFFTGVDTASTTTLTAFMRSLLDDPDQATAQATLGLTGGGGGSSTFLGLTDTPASYSGQAGNLVTVNSGATALDYTPLTAAGRALLDDADTAAQRATLGLGTLAQQDAANVAITGGRLSVGGHTPTSVVDVQASVQASDIANAYLGLRVWPNAPAGALYAHALRVEPATGAGLATTGFNGLVIMDQPVTLAGASALLLLMSAGANRYNIYASGTAPNYFAGQVAMENRVAIGDTASPDAYLRVRFPRASYYGLKILPSDNDTGAGSAIIFANLAGTTIGSIHTTAAATAFNTTSDVRLKCAIATLSGALERVRALRPVSFRWQADDSPGVGFLAHELQRTIPEAVTGQPDEVNDDGSIRPQGVDHSKLVPWLTAGLQAALAQIDALTARVTTLEEALGL